jgi:hypothetical protein
MLPATLAWHVRLGCVGPSSTFFDMQVLRDLRADFATTTVYWPDNMAPIKPVSEDHRTCDECS